MKLALKILAGFALSLTAPVVTLFYRQGWFNTPDDPVSPRGLYEKTVLAINSWVLKKTGNVELANWVSDYWWLGFRNRAYGFDYAMKPDFFKNLTSYADLNMTIRTKRKFGIMHRVVWVEGYEEHMFSLWFFHILYGYRLRPLYDTAFANKYMNAKIPHFKHNMDARPILSVRWGKYDD